MRLGAKYRFNKAILDFQAYSTRRRIIGGAAPNLTEIGPIAGKQRQKANNSGTPTPKGCRTIQRPLITAPQSVKTAMQAPEGTCGLLNPTTTSVYTLLQQAFHFLAGQAC